MNSPIPLAAGIHHGSPALQDNLFKTIGVSSRSPLPSLSPQRYPLLSPVEEPTMRSQYVTTTLTSGHPSLCVGLKPCFIYIVVSKVLHSPWTMFIISRTLTKETSITKRSKDSENRTFDKIDVTRISCFFVSSGLFDTSAGAARRDVTSCFTIRLPRS